MSKFTNIGVICLGIWVVLVGGDVGDEVVKFQDPKACNLSHNDTFSPVSLGCVKCHWGSEDSCPCPPGTRNLEGETGCSGCPEGKALHDGKHCLECGPLNPFSLTLGRCQKCPTGHIEVGYNADGSPKNILDCIQCAPGFQPSPSGNRCDLCHQSFPASNNNGTTNGTCPCPEPSHGLLGGVCFTSQELSEPSNIDTKTAYKIEYEGHKAESPLFRENLLPSFYLCKGRRNRTACEMLTNMCVLNLHSYGEEWSACRLYRAAISGAVTHPPPHIPKLYYSEVEAPSLLIRSSLIPHVHTTKPTSDPSSYLNITMATFSFAGEFLGLFPLQEVLPCSKEDKLLSLPSQFGTTVKLRCETRLKELLKKMGGKTFFLDPYLSYEALEGKQSHHLYPVPVKVLSLKQNGVKVNTLEDIYRWQFVRRFFVVDTIGTLEASTTEEGQTVPKTIRYLKRLHVRVQLQNSKDAGKIYVPLITLEYGEVGREELLRNPMIPFQFSVDYVMDMSRSLEDLKISVGVLSALAVLWSATQAWSWNRRNGMLEIDLTTLFNLLVTACGNLADIFFLVSFSAALFWFVFFKEQKAVHIFLPDVFQERLVRDLLITAFALKIVAVLELVRRQSTIDIFFIDWERPKVRSNVHQVQKEEGGEVGKGGEDSVSIWRTYFIANEWNEIQTTRKVGIAVHLMAVLFLLEVAGFRNYGLHWPQNDAAPEKEILEGVPFSTSARFVIGTIIFSLCGMIQWLWRVGFYERYVENEIQDFVDLCTMANISVFVLAAKQHGHYIHGRSVQGFADTDMQTMIEQLKREEEDLCGRRGLLPQTDQQTFLISLPASFRNVYDQVMQPLYASSASYSNLKAFGVGSKGVAGAGRKPTSNMLSLSVHAYQSMNRFLTAFLEHALSDLDYDIVNKTFFEKLLDMEFNEVGGDRAVFYTDDGHSFDSVLFYGHERTLFLFNLFTFIFVDILSHNFILAAVVVFVSDKGLKMVRNFLGKRNLAKKTLIDSRFLI